MYTIFLKTLQEGLRIMIWNEKKDEELLVSSLSNESAFSLLVERWWKKIYSFIFFKIGSADEAKELTQEVFLKIYLNIENFNPAYKFSTWIYKIAQNLSIDFLRKKHMVMTELTNQSLITKKTPLTEIIKEEKNKEIWDALEKLPEDLKEIILLRHQEELSYEEISEILNLKLGTVKNRIFKARKLLEEIIGEEDGKM